MYTQVIMLFKNSNYNVYVLTITYNFVFSWSTYSTPFNSKNCDMYSFKANNVRVGATPWYGRHITQITRGGLSLFGVLGANFFFLIFPDVHTVPGKMPPQATAQIAHIRNGPKNSHFKTGFDSPGSTHFDG